MSTQVIITGSGTPLLVAGRAGPGTLIRTDTTTIQVDVGRATAMRMAEAGVPLVSVDALLLTHHHSDHMLGLADLLLARWMENGVKPYTALPIHCPTGPSVDYVEHVFDQLEGDIQSRLGVSGYPNRPEPTVIPFDAGGARFDIGRIGDVMIEAATVDHGDLAPAVGFRFSTPDGVVVVSGDTTICPDLEALAAGADILVHEAFSADMLSSRGVPAHRIENLGHHHADARLVGELAARAGVSKLLITHMIPAPTTPDEVEVYRSAIRDGGFDGELTIADDLASMTI